MCRPGLTGGEWANAPSWRTSHCFLGTLKKGVNACSEVSDQCITGTCKENGDEKKNIFRLVEKF